MQLENIAQDLNCWPIVIAAVMKCITYINLIYTLVFKFTFSYLADAFIQSNLQMRTIKPTKEQLHASAMTSRLARSKCLYIRKKTSRIKTKASVRGSDRFKED